MWVRHCPLCTRTTGAVAVVRGARQAGALVSFSGQVSQTSRSHCNCICKRGCSGTTLTSPMLIWATPSSQPCVRATSKRGCAREGWLHNILLRTLITSPRPSLNSNFWPLSRDESNLEPSVSVPAGHRARASGQGQFAGLTCRGCMVRTRVVHGHSLAPLRVVGPVTRHNGLDRDTHGMELLLRRGTKCMCAHHSQHA